MESPDLIINLPLPAEMPVMVLPECHLFPGCLLPLYIFEERYRVMLEHALQNNRMFCVGNRAAEDADGVVSPYSTAGLVRACVQQKDGTSQLLLLGTQRIRLNKWIQKEPFRIAAIEPVQTVIEDDLEAQNLKDQALQLLHDSKEESNHLLWESLSSNNNMELVCDVMSYHFTRCPKLQQKLLAESSLNKRFAILVEALQKSKCK
ncbi:hypothetical protein BH11VER1_BH11VER1_32790 [soil metagenome]